MSYMKKINAKNPILGGKDIFITYGFMCPQYGSAHYGTDIRTSELGKSDDLVAIEDGEVVAVKDTVKKTLDITVKANWSSPDALGNYVTIKHNGSYSSRYGHIAYGSLKVKVGDKVKKGQTIGKMGITGLTTGMHTHFEVWENGVRVDGEPFITGERSFTAEPKPVEPTKTVAEIASEVIVGKWSVGEERKARLTAAGYSYEAVMEEVNAWFDGKNKTATVSKDAYQAEIDIVANEVIVGKWGAGAERVRRLTEAGWDAKIIQARVNELFY